MKEEFGWWICLVTPNNSLQLWGWGGRPIGPAALTVKLVADRARGLQSRAVASAPPQSPRWPLPRCRCCPARRPRTLRTPGLARSATLPTWCRRSGRWWRPESAAAGCSPTPPRSRQGRCPPPPNPSPSHPARGPPSAYTPGTSS